MRSFVTIALSSVAVLVLSCTTAVAWTTEELNKVVNQTNFIVDNICSGTLISLEKKIVLTNHHCVAHKISFIEKEEVGSGGEVKKIKRERRDKITLKQNAYRGATLVGSSTYQAEILGYRHNRDLAILQIMANEIPHTIATPLVPETSEIIRGEQVWAVGNPIGLDATVTSGIVSSLNRTFRFPWAENEDLPMIQYSAPTNPGNSGGALYNDKGQLVGVPAASFNGAEGLNLAVPIEMIREVLKENCLESISNSKADDAACTKKKLDEENRKKKFNEENTSTSEGDYESDVVE